MALIFVYPYQHSDAALLQPVADELARRGHNIMSDITGYPAFLRSHGKRALLLVSDYATFEHAEGQSAVKQAYWAGVPSFSIQHGIPFSQMDAHIVKGTHTAAHTFFWGEYWPQFFNYNDAIIAGNPALDVVDRFDRTAAKKVIRDAYGVDKLGLLCPNLDGIQTGAEFHNAVDGEKVKRFLRAAQEMEFDGTWAVRPHPSALKRPEQTKIFEHMAHVLGGFVQRPYDSVHLYEILAAADVVCGMSTVIYEAFAFGCRVVPLGMDALPAVIDDPFDGRASTRISEHIERLI